MKFSPFALNCILVSALFPYTSYQLAAQAEPSPGAQNPPANQSQAPSPPQPSSSTAPTPLSTSSMTGPLQAAPPTVFDTGPLGKLDVNGVISGLGLWQGHPVSGDNATDAALSNAQIFVQKTDGWWQFYLQAGAYNILSLGTPFLATDKAISNLWGPVPVAYLKVVPSKNTSILIGALPALMGSEYTFDFENMNIERGLLWNQENSVNRGIQLNQAFARFTASLSWNDGYYSNRYSWLSGSLTWTSGPHSLTFVGMGNLSQTRFQTLATPVQNNSVMSALEYTYTKGNWIVQPYYQYSDVPTNLRIGIVRGATTERSGAVLLSRQFKHGVALSGRAEAITSGGGAQAVNLLYGPGSSAWSVTVTPTYQHKRFFLRGDLSVVHASSFTPGDAFGSAGKDANQPRGVLETGVLF